MREILDQKNEPAWRGSIGFFIASVKDERGLTDAQWLALTSDERLEKCFLSKATAEMNEWARLTDDERKELTAKWRVKKMEEAKKAREGGDDA